MGKHSNKNWDRQSMRSATNNIKADNFMASYRRGRSVSSFQAESVESNRQKLKRLRILRRRLLAILLSVAISIGLGVALLSQLTSRINSVVAKDGVILEKSDQERYASIVDNYLGRNSSERLSFIRRNTVLLQIMREQAPEIADFQLVTSGLASSQLRLNIRKPVAMWVDGDGAKSYVDAKGVVFERNYFGEPSIAIKDDSGIKLLGGAATSAKFLSFIGRVSVNLENNYNIKVERVVIPKGSARYAELYLVGRPYPFKVQITRDSYSQATDISVMVRYIDNHNIRPNYVDCRVEGKAYWR